MTYNIPDIELLEDFNEDRPVDDRTTSATEEEKSLIEIFFLKYGFNISVIDIKRGLKKDKIQRYQEFKRRFKVRAKNEKPYYISIRKKNCN